MITVVMRSRVTDNTREQALALYKKLIAQTVKEQGCLKYELFCEADNKNNLALIEQWLSKDHLHAHTKTEHFIRLVAKLSELEVEEPVLIYEKINL